MGISFREVGTVNAGNEVNLAEVGWDLVLMVNELLHAVQLVDEGSEGDWPVLPRKGMSKHEVMYCICAAMEHHARVLLQLRLGLTSDEVARILRRKEGG